MKTKNLIVLIFLLSYYLSQSQIGPNVVAGAEGVVFNKGKLDAELILEMVATKKGEIKSELGKRLVLSKIENGSFAFYNYAEKNLDILFNEANKEIIMKEIMRNSAEVMLVYGISEIVLLDLKNKNSLTQEEINFLKMIEDYQLLSSQNFKDFLQIIGVKLDAAGFSKITYVEFNSSNQNIQPWISGITKTDQNINKPVALNLLTQSLNSYRESSLRLSEQNTNYNLSHMFVDMVYDVCRNNNHILKTGLFQNNNYSEERYTALNKFKMMEDKNSNIYKPLAGLQPQIKKIIDNVFKYYGVLEDVSALATIDDANIDNLKNVINQTLIDKLKTKTIDNTLSTDVDVQKILTELKAIGTNTNCLKNSLADLKNAIKNIKGKYIVENSDLAKEQSKLLKKIASLSFISTPTIVTTMADYKYSLEKDIIPQLYTLNNSTDNNYTDLLNSLISFRNCLNNSILDDFKNNKGEFTSVINNAKLYIPIVKCFDNLNRVESYDYIFKYITNLAETYGSQQAKTVVRWITSSADKYVTINTEANNLTLDVEAIAGDFYSRFAKNQKNRLNMLFTVGANLNVSSQGQYEYLIGSDVKKFNNQQFISEKIGIRFNIMDFNRKRQLGNYDLTTGHFKKDKRRAAKIGKSPLIDNWHLQAYGSGLMYQITALNSESDFKKPMYGFGTGISFFNGLDFSINYMSPFDDKIENGFFNFAFDVSFMEYLGELKKKKAKKEDN